MKQTNMMKLIGVVGVTTATAFIGVGEANAIPVALDTFEVDSSTVTPSSATTSVTGNSNQIIGGARKVELLSSNQTDSRVSSGQLRVSSDDRDGFETPGDVILRYDGSTTNPDQLTTSGLGSIDLTDGGSNTGLKFEGIRAVSDVTVTFFSNNGSLQTSFTKQLNQFLTSESFLEFTDFTGDASFNFEQVSAASLQLTAFDEGQQPRISAVGATPSINDPVIPDDPAAVPFEAESGMALVAVGGLIAYRKLRKRGQNQIDS